MPVSEMNEGKIEGAKSPIAHDLDEQTLLHESGLHDRGKFATDLAGLLHETGRAEEAISILQPVHNWFSRGWDYPDLQRARAMLDKIKV